MKDIYLDLTEKMLKRLNQYRKNLEKYEDEKMRISSIGNIDYTKEKLSPTNKIFSEVENYLINEYIINSIIDSLNNKINTIESNLNKLNAIDRKLLTLRYIEGWRISSIADECNYDYDYVRQKIKRALYKLKKLMYDH